MYVCVIWGIEEGAIKGGGEGGKIRKFFHNIEEF
jgi:hypothetical protein